MVTAGAASVDRGWAWFVLAGAVLWNFTISGTLKSFGILYMEFMHFYDTSPSQTGAIGFTFAFMMLVLAPLSGYLGDRVSCRGLMLVGGVVAASGVFLTGFAHSLPTAIFTYGIIAGSAVGIMDGPVFTTLNKYFHARRGFANSMAFVGSGIGALCLPILLRISIDAYTIQGTMFVLAGLWLHACVIGALFRPINLRIPVEQINVMHGPLEPDKTLQGPIEQAVNTEQGVMKDRKQNTNPINNCYDVIYEAERNCNEKEQHSGTEMVRETSKTAGSNTGINKSYTDQSKTLDPLLANSNESNSAHSSKQKSQEIAESYINTSASNSHRTRVQYVSDSIKKGGKRYVTFLNNPQMLRTVLAVMFGCFAYFNQMFLFPSLAQEIGLSKLEGAYLVSLPGMAEVCSRIPLGLFSDLKFVNKPLLVCVSSTLCCILGLCVSLHLTRSSLFVYALMLGVLGGTLVPLAMPMLASCVRAHDIGSASGLFLLAMSSSFALGPPVFGLLREVLGSYAMCFRICVLVYVPAIALLLADAVRSCRPQTKAPAACMADTKHDDPSFRS